MQIIVNNAMDQGMFVVNDFTKFNTVLDYANFLLQINDGKKDIEEINFFPSELIITTKFGTDIVVFLAGYPNLTAIKQLVVAEMDKACFGQDDVNIECDYKNRTVHIWID